VAITATGSGMGSICRLDGHLCLGSDFFHDRGHLSSKRSGGGKDGFDLRIFRCRVHVAGVLLFTAACKPELQNSPTDTSPRMTVKEILHDSERSLTRRGIRIRTSIVRLRRGIVFSSRRVE